MASTGQKLTGIPADFADGVDNNDAKLTEAEVDDFVKGNNISDFANDVNYVTADTETDPTITNATQSDGSACEASDVLLYTGTNWECSTNVSGTGKWSDGATSGDIVYTGGNVGIGTTDPGCKARSSFYKQLTTYPEKYRYHQWHCWIRKSLGRQ